MNDLLTEITTERYYALQPAAFNAYRRNIMRGAEAKRGYREECRRSFACFAEGKLVTKSNRLTDFKAYDESYDDEENAAGGTSDVKYINILRLTGPITRGGGECSYGSIEMRDELMRAADNDDVIAHIIYARTPGGAASALLDYRKAIDYIHSRGQKVYMFCDGMIASCGTFLAAMCDGVYAYNAGDEIGSIGLYIAYMGLPSGAVDAVSQETYVEVYATKSTDKNLSVREAMKGNLEPTQQEADEYLDMLLANMKADRPAILDEQMTGDMYKMGDVVGTLIDGVCSLSELCELAYNEWAATQSANINPNNENMKEYKNIALALGYEEPVASQVDDMLTLQTQEADLLEEKLAGMASSVETLSAENTSLKEREVALTSSLATMTIERDAARKEAEELRAAMSETNETKVNAVREEMQATIDSMTAEKSALEEALAGTTAQLTAINDEMTAAKATAEEAAKQAAEQLAEKEQIIADLQAQLAEAQSGIDNKVDAGESPANNGAAAAVATMSSGIPTWDNGLSASENQARMKAYLEAQRKKI